ncbi:rhodanese-like domain-containing protein [Fervidibacillus halotolerans]|uniref:Rhodanese-like domain-containing protein n=1 Tax=Fervidibacillus halotolerans TaxID=2980027 RepID=A0A9E8M0W6_9BACI|nr:rhodanese-like domain-containing protein [Fervidibacillus halotolerans]WAA13332.1 rhodanese-like domain-containing protein [Fervidibacillus halotolerans]
MIYLLIILGILFIEQFYKRYVPIQGIDFREIDTIDRREDIVLLDIRDYQEAAKDEIPGSINIPFAYLKRFYREIPNKKIHLIASNCMEKNIGVRYLKKYGFSVQSYTVKEQKCKNSVVSVFN